eukprot:GHVN01088075.1.p2 GENE.GHVN01088075.1~~GHVN01088075.1.p2  ORF type:complete len:101 (-),score=1.16 GHVN01088075.1:62-364(-)
MAIKTPPIDLVLPNPSAEYSQMEMDLLLRTLETILDRLDFPLTVRGGRLYLTDLPSNGSGLATGEVFEDNGLLKIVRSGDVFVGTLLATGAVGTVTVTTT